MPWCFCRVDPIIADADSSWKELAEVKILFSIIIQKWSSIATFLPQYPLVWDGNG